MSIVIPVDSNLYRQFDDWIRSKRILFVAGLPAVGKSLYLQQLAVMAREVDRPVHLLQWDVVRAAFERDGWLDHYPELEGVTHPVIRKATGIWARQAIADWDASVPSSHLLIAELPLIGNRLMELVQRQDDDAERLLSGHDTHALIPVPTLAVRAHLEQRRVETIRAPTVSYTHLTLPTTPYV